ncbi:hypothetical protein ACT9SR_13305, partial [Enterococcus faecalis]|uniref:hypothetical protein n=1 Tax=Enterococcus faecalis TaxID=1351 RepID=UPI004039CB30
HPKNKNRSMITTWSDDDGDESKEEPEEKANIAFTSAISHDSVAVVTDQEDSDSDSDSEVDEVDADVLKEKFLVFAQKW